MEENKGFGFGIRGVAEVVDVAIWAQAADDGGAWWGINGLALGADGDFAVVADADAGLLASRDVQQGLFVGAVGQPGVRAGVVF